MGTTLAIEPHTYSLQRRLDDRPGNHPAAPQHRYACTCGFATTWLSTRIHKNPQEKPGGCPNDPTVRALTTLQFANGGLFDSTPVDHLIHLVRATNRGTPGPTLCNIDRFAKDSPGWSVGGGVSDGTIVLNPCDGCAAAARTEFPGLPVHGSVGGAQMAQKLGVGYTR
jgi:hypothetical protein